MNDEDFYAAVQHGLSMAFLPVCISVAVVGSVLAICFFARTWNDS